jgi:hypothetical protein
VRLVNTREESFAELLTSSYRKLVGEELVPEGPGVGERLYQAPFGLLAHDTSPDPVFVYANLWVQRLFEYDWDEFVGLASRLSAGQEDREARRVLLENVQSQGFTRDYRGPRVAKSGRQFWIEDVTVWNLLDAEGVRVGQAALIRSWQDL